MSSRRAPPEAALSPPSNPDELRRLRRRLGLTQTQLGAALGLSMRAIRHYEAGSRPLPRVVALACLAVAAGLVDVTAMAAGLGSESKPTKL